MKRNLLLLFALAGCASADVITVSSSVECNGVAAVFRCSDSTGTFVNNEYAYGRSSDLLEFNASILADVSATRGEYQPDEEGNDTRPRLAYAESNIQTLYGFQTGGQQRQGFIDLIASTTEYDENDPTGSAEYQIGQYSGSGLRNERLPFDLGVGFTLLLAGGGFSTETPWSTPRSYSSEAAVRFVLYEADGVTPVQIKWADEINNDNPIASPEPGTVMLLVLGLGLVRPLKNVLMFETR